MSLLQVTALTAAYGPSQALFGVDLELSEGEVLALLGRNGMGKTTTIRAMLGLTPPLGGAISFAGKDVFRLPPHLIARHGIGLVPEGRRCFPNLTVLENLTVASRPGPWSLSRIEQMFPRLAERRDQRAISLSGGEQQMLAIGRALMTNPRLLILDEATEGLAPVIRQDIWEAIRTLKAEGQSILVVDKSLAELLVVADKCAVLENGRTVWTGTATKLDTATQDRYLGV
jgi:branched-chain amino acid transport system ATP-binding protein